MNKNTKRNIKYFLKFLPDKPYLKLFYFFEFRKRLNLKNPQTFNEKLQWLKLHDRKDIYTTMVDKYEAKKYVAKILGENYIIPTLGVYDSFDEIDFEKLPNQFVIKCTHDSDGLIIVKNKSELDKKSAREKINKCLKRNYYYSGREWPYKNVKPRVIVEKYMEDKKYGELRDYKIYSFDGKCDYVMVCFDRFKDKTKFIYFDKNWQIQKELSNDGLKYGDSIIVEKPQKLDEMFQLAKKFSKGIPFLRVDFYEVDGQVYFGEFTFFPSAGFDNKRTKACQEYLDKSLILEDK